MRRREVIAVLSGAGVWLPLAGKAQQPERVRRVGMLTPFPENDALSQAFVAAFVDALHRLGWIEGRNISIEYRFAADPALFALKAKELVDLSPDVILAATPQIVAALKQHTQKIPIVFVLVIDPLSLGLVQSLARPGGNITGFSVYDAPITGKWLELLREIAPGVTRVTVIFNPAGATTAPLFNPAIQASAPGLGLAVTLAPVHDDETIEQAIAAEGHEAGGALIILPDTFAVAHRDVILAAASRHGLPTIGPGQVVAQSGALISYWVDTVDQYVQAASYVDRILKGEKPADLPVQQPTKFELVINLKTAKALGITVPQSLLARADEVIE